MVQILSINVFYFFNFCWIFQKFPLILCQPVSKRARVDPKSVTIYPPSPVSPPWTALCFTFPILFISQCRYSNYWWSWTAYVNWHTYDVKHCISISALRLSKYINNLLLVNYFIVFCVGLIRTGTTSDTKYENS